MPRATTSTTSTTTAEQRYAIPSDPAKIDAAYVNDVLAALAHVRGDVFRKYVTTRRFEPQDLIPLRAIYSDAEVQPQAEAMIKTPLGQPEDYQSPVGDQVITVVDLLAVRTDCVSVKVNRDYRAIQKAGKADVKSWISLRPKPANIDPTNLNPTPWVIATERVSEFNGCDS